MSQTRSLDCKCGGVIFKNDEAQSIAHSDPECAAFIKLISEHPPDETHTIQPGTMQAHFDAFAVKVRNSKKGEES